MIEASGVILLFRLWTLSSLYTEILSGESQGTGSNLGGWDLQQCFWPSSGGFLHTHFQSGSGFPTILCAVLTESFLSCAVDKPHIYTVTEDTLKLISSREESPTCFSFLRSWVCRAFFTRWEVLRAQVRSAVMWMNRNLMLSTRSTSTLCMSSGACAVLLKSTRTSLVLVPFKTRLCSEHHRARWWISSLWWVSSLPDTRPATVVSSANFTMVFEALIEVQLCVKRVKRAGLITHPCGVQNEGRLCINPYSYHLWSVG